MLELLNTYSSDRSRKVQLLSTKSSTGAWILENVEPYVPILITYSTTSTELGRETCGEVQIISGADYSTNTDAILGSMNDRIRGSQLVFIPTYSTVELSVKYLTNTCTLYAFQ